MKRTFFLHLRRENGHKRNVRVARSGSWPSFTKGPMSAELILATATLLVQIVAVVIQLLRKG